MGGGDVVWRGVGAGDSKTKTTHTSLDAKFPPIMYLAFPSFQRTLYHRTKIISLYGLSSLGAIVFVRW